MVTFGVFERTGMKVTGYETSSVFNRYHVVSPADGQEVIQKLMSPCTDKHLYGQTLGS